MLLAGQSVWPCTVPEWPCAAADWMSYRACGCTLELPAIESHNTSIAENGIQLWMISCETDDSGSKTSCHHGPNGVSGCSSRPCGYVEEEVDLSVFAPPLSDSTRQLKLSFVARTRGSFSAFIDDIRLTYKIPGCMDTSACNYNPTAEIDDGTCAAQIRGCTLPTAVNFDPYANMDPGDRCSAFTSDWLQPDGTPTFNLLHNVALRPVTRSPRITISTDDALVLNYNTSNSARQLSAGVYPYWSVRLQLSGVPDTEDRRCRFHVKVRSPGAVALSTILYNNFASVSPSNNVTSGVECEHMNGELTGGHAFCPSNTQLVTSISYGVEYTLIVIPSDLNQSPDAMDDPFDLDILALEGSIAIISPVCGNGIVDALEQCDPVDAGESYLNGADAEWCSETCQGILGSFAFETDSISIAEGEEAAVKVVRKLPPDWIPNDAGTQTVNIQIFNSDGTATSAEDDFERIERKMIEFLPSETMSTPIVIESQVDFVYEYPTEHFFLNMELICDTPSCDYSTALHYPHQLRIEIRDQNSWYSDFQVVIVFVLCALLLVFSIWITIWSKAARLHAIDKVKSRRIAAVFEDQDNHDTTRSQINSHPFVGYPEMKRQRSRAVISQADIARPHKTPKKVSNKVPRTAKSKSKKKGHQSKEHDIESGTMHGELDDKALAALHTAAPRISSERPETRKTN